MASRLSNLARGASSLKDPAIEGVLVAPDNCALRLDSRTLLLN